MKETDFRLRLTFDIPKKLLGPNSVYYGIHGSVADKQGIAKQTVVM